MLLNVVVVEDVERALGVVGEEAHLAQSPR